MVWIETHADSWLIEKHAIDLFEGAARCLNTEEPSQWDEAEADDAPNPEEVAANVVQTDWSHHDDDELQDCQPSVTGNIMGMNGTYVGKPVREYTNGHCLVANSEWLSLGRI